MSRRTITTTLAALGLLLAAVALPRQARACGGCFSPPPPPGRQNQQLILQDAERVFFHYDGKTGKTLTWVEVKYSGLAEDFAWVLPLPSVPKVGVGSSWVFDQLDQRHAPRFRTRVDPQDENCRDWDTWCYGPKKSADLGTGGGFAGAADAGASAPGERNDSDGKNGVTVIAKDKAGPYDYVVLAAKDPKKLLDWLNKNGFDTPSKALPIIESHLKKGDVFVGFKLQNSAGVNEIRPVVLEMEDADPCVPLRLTSIAASDNMSVVVTLTGAGRAVPKNHMHVQMNPTKLNWFASANNYPQALAEAIDEAAGHAFVTEYAGDASETVLINKNNRMESSFFKTVTNAAELGRAIVLSKLLLNDDSANTIERVTGLAKLAGQEPLQFYANLRSCGYSDNYKQGYCFNRKRQQGTLPVDGPKVAAALEKDFIGPIQTLVEGIAASDKITRLVLRISPEEMDRDPIFDFNPDLPDVSNELEATFRKVCSKGWRPYDMVRLTIPGFGSWVIDGRLPGDSGTVGNNAVDSRFIDAPWAHVIEVMDTKGQGKVVAESDIDLVDNIIAGAQMGQPTVPPKFTLAEGGPRWKIPADDKPRVFVDKRDDSECTVYHAVKPWQTAEEVVQEQVRVDTAGAGCTAGTRGGAPAAALLLLLLGALALRRRRI